MAIRIAGWIAVALANIILLIFATSRLTDMAANPPGADGFGIRYVQNAGVAILHILPGMFFLAVAPLQFVTRIRQRHLKLHRRLGWLLALCATLSGVFALVASFRLPAFGGIPTQSATLFFGAIFLFSIVKAIWHIRHKHVRLHREWMIRVVAVAMGAATIRLFIGLFVVVLNYSFEDVFGVAFWLGFAVNLIAAEIWINHSRVAVPLIRPQQPSGRGLVSAGR